MIDSILKELGTNFALVSGPFYIAAKIFIKTMIHRLAAHQSPIDNWTTYVWTSVDLSFLSVSISIATNLPERANFDYHMSVAWYIVICTCFILSCLMYGLFVMNRQKLNGVNPLTSRRLLFNMSGCGFFGIVPFFETINRLQ